MRQAREAAGVSQLELALAIGYTAANPVSKMERGETTGLDIGRLAAVARALRIELEWLIEPAARVARGMKLRR